MTVTMVLAALLALATLIGWARLALWQARAAPDTRSSGWRLAALAALQPVCAALLYLTLMPPRWSSPSGALVIATRNAAPTAALALGERLIALPEAPSLPGAERAPDLATALRAQDATRLRILGDGLEPRDREAALGRTIAFDPGPRPKGLVRLNPPKRVAPGAAFTVGGRVAGLSGGAVELVDPAGRRVDASPLSVGDFTLHGTVRVPGLALFKLRVLDSRRGDVETADVPVWTAAEPPPRMLLVAGAPGPEVKYLRRWATDAGIALHTRLSTGGGLELGDAPLRLNAMTLSRFDIAVLDERSWAALSGGERSALADAVQGGLGLLLRITGPVSPGVRRDWQMLGLVVSTGATTAPAQLRTGTRDEEARRARQGLGSRDRPTAVNAGSEASALTRRVVGRPRPDSVSAALDTASWRARGRGRVGLWTLTDSFALILSGDDDRYGELWSETLQRLTRPQAEARAEIGGLARQGQRVTLCNLAGPSEVQAANGQVAKLLIDPASERSACAAYWPGNPGWHLLRRSGPKADLSPLPFFVYPANGLPGVRASETRDATLRLMSGNSSRAASLKPLSSRGSSWPWFLGWLAASGFLWWLERARVGKRRGFGIDSAAAAS